MEMKFSQTSRGFARYDFADFYGVRCSLQKSSLATDDAIWLGCDEYKVHHVTGNICGRMHLSREQVAALLPVLQHFMMTGEVSNQPAYVALPSET